MRARETEASTTRRALAHVRPKTRVGPLLPASCSQACSCKMDLDHSVGSILCDNCGAKYSMRINRLTEPIDVYSEWIDSARGRERAVLLYHLDARSPTHTVCCGR